MIRPDLIVAYGPRGRGIWTLKPIPKGGVVEVAPCVDLPDVQGMGVYSFHSYTPELTRIAFGYAMMYAHSAQPNMEAIHDSTSITFYATQDIAPGDELTQDYGPDFWPSDSVLIDARIDG